MVLTDHEHFLLNLLKIGEGDGGLLLPDRRYDNDGALQVLCTTGLVQRSPEPCGFHRYTVTAEGNFQLRKLAEVKRWRK
jgi:hypothetical protein